MSATASNMTLVDKYLDAPCLTCDGSPPAPTLCETCKCPDCQGTGHRRPEFWKRCGVAHSDIDGAFATRNRDGQPIPCSSCDGSGWVRDVTLEKVFDRFDELGLGYKVTRNQTPLPDGKIMMYRFSWYKGMRIKEAGFTWGPTREAAALEALMQVGA